LNNKAKELRKQYANTNVLPYKFPMLWIRDKCDGSIHLYGTDSHDSLYIGKNGNIAYYNLQNGDGTGDGGTYEFVNFDEDGMMYNQILHLYTDENEVN
jgi:hypothetical protein